MSNKRIRNRDMEAVRRAMGFDPRNPTTGITLSDVEAAYVTMIETEFAAAVQVAQQKRGERFAVVMKTYGILDGSRVNIVAATETEPMRLDVTPPAGMVPAVSPLNGNAVVEPSTNGKAHPDASENDVPVAPLPETIGRDA